jgi:hypothetical protein
VKPFCPGQSEISKKTKCSPPCFMVGSDRNTGFFRLISLRFLLFLHKIKL